MRESYTIVFVTRNTHDVSAADATTARSPYDHRSSSKSGRKIKFIRSPQEGEFGVEMLRLLGKKKREEEMPIAPD